MRIAILKTNSTQHFLLFSREGCSPVKNIFNNNRSTSKKVLHSRFMQHCQKAMQEVYSKVKDRNESLQKKSKTIMTKKCLLQPSVITQCR